MNYPEWFYEQYKYLKGSRNGNESYNDTKWISMIDRYKTLVDMESQLLTNQSFGVVSNKYGFRELFQIMNLSNYTFDDIHTSLVNTYNRSLQNLMGKMIVDTGCVIFHTRSTDIRYVMGDKSGEYFIVEAPFDQMHFGERDEFIRQRLHQMHTTENDYYIPMDKFISDEISDILGFNLLISVNGYICNDWKVAIDDKGFKFKVRWGYTSDVDFIIYKLDDAFVFKCDVSMNEFQTMKIRKSSLPKEIYTKHGNGRYKCIINAYDNRFKSSVLGVCNFGILDNSGLTFTNLQNKTINTLQKNGTQTVTMVVYVLKYFQEVPNLYPAINYYDMIFGGKIYTDKHDNVVDINDNVIYGYETSHNNGLEICTPPICLDRNSNVTFGAISTCLQMEDKLMSMKKDMSNMFSIISFRFKNITQVERLLKLLRTDTEILKTQYQMYMKCALLTSLIPDSLIKEFGYFVDNMNKILTTTQTLYDLAEQGEDVDWNDISKYDMSQMINYTSFVQRICSPFKNEKLQVISDMGKIVSNFYPSDVNNHSRFNRPVSEYSFISMKYDHDEECWLFTYPDIKRFHGIENTFYIDSGINGDEIYKFFVLYSDTENPSEKNVEPLDVEHIIDFDLFVDEVMKHEGYVRYWYAENMLLKLSNVMYGKYDSDTQIQVLSRMLKRKMDSNGLLWDNPSDIEYELSALQSFDYKSYNENSIGAPFSVNFLFYTLSMMVGNEDKLESYFMSSLVNDKFNNRYSDIDISQYINDGRKFPVNFSSFCKAPTSIDLSNSVICNQHHNSHLYYGYPRRVSETGEIVESGYDYIFNSYDNHDITFPYIEQNGYTDQYYLGYGEDISDYGYEKYNYSNDIRLITLITKYITSVYSYMSEFQTDYDKPFLRTNLCDIALESINHYIYLIREYINSNHLSLQESYQIANVIIDRFNPIISNIKALEQDYSILYNTTYGNTPMTIFALTNNLISDIRRVYSLFGFDNYALKPVRSLYIHLKKINTKMNVYEFRQWISGINYSLLALLDKMLARNENIDIPSDLFKNYRIAFAQYVSTITATDVFNDIKNRIDSFSGSIYNDHINPILTHCTNIINNYTFDLYAIKSIELTNVDIQHDAHIPSVVVSIDLSDPHFHIPSDTSVSGTSTLVFDPMVDELGYRQHVIQSLRNICEYTFFDGSDITGLSAEFRNLSNQVIGTAECNITFVRVGSTSDKSCDFNMLMNIIDSPFDFQNIHETFDINQNHIINEKRHPMNYEMLVGNRFFPLDNTSEMIVSNVKELPGPIDRVYISNQSLNRLAIDAYGGHDSVNMYFKPSQVIHLPIDNNVMTSVGGKYAVGQRLYLYTKDLGLIVPVTVTAIDASQSHGFVEATVDSYESKWYKITDDTYVNKYLTEDIECDIIDDNISNFLDEYNNSEFVSYNVIKPYDDNVTPDSLPGDPIYVTTNSDYVYTRLNYFFSPLVPNRFIDETHKMYTMTYIGSSSISLTTNKMISLNMLSHDYNNYTDPELFPILRDEPNDHEVWDEEKRVFEQYKTELTIRMDETDAIRKQIYIEMMECDDPDEYRNLVLLYEQSLYEINHYESMINKINYMIEQPEKPSTWFNVNTYDAALVYMNNGRAKPFTSFISNISYVEFTDKVGVYVYDWENKRWLNPSSYIIIPTVVNNIKYNNKDAYETNDVLYKIDIQFNNTVIESSKILIYFGYMKSDIFDDITINDKSCYVRFKPILSTSKPIDSFDIYKDIRIRKHFDGDEVYKFDQTERGEEVIADTYHVKRTQRNGEYMNSPIIRFKDLTVTQNNHTYDYSQFRVYVRNPFPDVNPNTDFMEPGYDAVVAQDIDGFEPGQHIKLICVSNNTKSSYDGNVSNIIFDAVTSYEYLTTNQKVTVTNATTELLDEDYYICTVLPDQSTKAVGGIIKVTVTYHNRYTADSLHKWYRVPESFAPYLELPDEFHISPKLVGWDNYTPATVRLHNQYVKDIDDTINKTNDQSINNPYEYYYDTKNNTKLPLSDTRRNNHEERLVVDTSVNTDIKLIKSTYIGICRYSLNHIPENGFIDVTGFIPTPLSRKRYEFYVNGRDVNSFDNLRILSPTTFQLCNLRSLRNFELVELVDDMYQSPVFKEGPVYVSMDGKVFSSYEHMLKSNTNILTEDIRYVFNTENHHQLNDFVGDILDKPNNIDIEDNILDSIVDTASSTDYDQLCNLPSINGVTVLHLTSRDIGFSELEDDKIFTMFDNVWKKERLTDIDFPYTHRTDNHIHTVKLRSIPPENIGIDNPEDWICIQITSDMRKYFSLYVSNDEDSNIDDMINPITSNTLKVIPFVCSGMYVLIDKESYKGHWLHATYPNTTPILI